jgi:hypothetical protein
MTIYNKHHKVPKHMGGTDDPSNIEILTVEEHAEAHRILYEQYGCWQDEIAWKGLSGIVGKDEILKEIYRHNGKTMGLKNKGRTPWNNGLTKDDPRVAKYCTPVGYKFKDTSKMGRYERTPEILEKLKVKKSAEHKEKLRIKSKEQFSDAVFKENFIMKMKSLRAVCPYCGMESNKSNITRHMKKCVKN